jgi:hypothetical protein
VDDLKARATDADQERRERLNKRRRAAFIEGAEEDSRRRLDRGLTTEELERVVWRYPAMSGSLGSGSPEGRGIPGPKAGGRGASVACICPARHRRQSGHFRTNATRTRPVVGVVLRATSQDR